MTGSLAKGRTASRELTPLGRSRTTTQTDVKRARVAPALAAAGWDRVTIGATVALVSVGLVVLYSASSVFAARAYGDAEHFLALQTCWIAVGLVGLVAAAQLDGRLLRRIAGVALVASVVLCALVLVPGIGHLAGGARRWLVIGGMSFQPSELAKLAVVLLLAAVLAAREGRPPAERPSLLVPVLVAQVPVALILAEPDLGSALVIELILAVMVFAAGLRLRVLALAALAALPVFYHLLVGTPFRLQRLLSFIDPWAYRTTVGYQVTEALISIGAGGLFGNGLGESKHKLFFLPAAHTDFIFAILAEELGFVGVVGLLLLFGVLIWRGLGATTRAATAFDAYLAIGVTALVGVPALFNVGVATGLLPTKGLPLPLVSYGGSNLVATLIAVGLLLRVLRDGRDHPAGEGT